MALHPISPLRVLSSLLTSLYETKPLLPSFPIPSFPGVCEWVCVYVCVWVRMCALSHFSYVQLCNSMTYSPPGSSVHRIPQARILEWVPIPSFRGSFQPRDQTRVTCVSCKAGGFFTTGKAHRGIKLTNKNCINFTVWWFYISIYCELIILVKLNKSQSSFIVSFVSMRRTPNIYS